MKRILGLDVLRGLAISIMIMVDAAPIEPYEILQHAQWEGLTIADLAFPLFVFVMGISAAITSSRKIITWKKILRRTISLFVLGLIFNAIATFLFGADFANFRIFGILQRLALTYAFSMAIVKIFHNDREILIAAIILLIASSLGFHLYAEKPFAAENNISGAVDLLFGANHIYTPIGDPEGLYGTIATTSTMLFGFLAGRWRDKMSWLIICGVTLLIFGGIWSSFDIISKNLWTAPFALITSGLNAILFAIFLRCDYFKPFAAMGKNPLFLFMASNIGLMILISAGIWKKLFEIMRLEILSLELNALIFSLIWVLLWAMVAKLLDKLGIVIKL